MKTTLNTLLGAALALLVTIASNPNTQAQPSGPILFNTLNLTNGGVFVPAQVYSVNADGTGLRQLTTGKTSAAGAAWHPSYQYVSFFRDGYLQVMEAAPESSRIRPFAVGAAQPIGADFSPDGKLITYVGPRPTDGKGAAIIIRSIDLARRKVGTPTMLWNQDCYAPSFSPDGTRISFSSHYNPTSSGGPHVKILELATGNVASLDAITGFIPSWSPDGQWLVFCGSTGSGSELFLVRPDGSELTQVTSLANPRGVAWPSFSPDGAELIFTSGYDGVAALYRVACDSGVVSLFQPSANAAHWTP